jgi:MoaA/NifB/PqqE/SkfB family radical SAM enzyme
MNNNIDKIYQELGDQVCLYPFFNGFYQTNHMTRVGQVPKNTIRPCSVINDQPKYFGEESTWASWDVNTTINDARNSDRWIELRKTFIEGTADDVVDCKACAFNDRTGAISARKMNNVFYAEHLSVDIIQEVKNIIANGYKTDKLITMDYYPSNYCNYECVMCSGGASSKRHTFEIKFLHNFRKLTLNQPDADFYELLKHVEIINLTGGETILQPQVEELIDYLIAQDLAKNLYITLITNASNIPTKMTERFAKFKNVFYTISIDGIDDVIEYQRRGCNWKTVGQNALFIYENYKSVVNCVLTAINVWGIDKLFDWFETHGITNICISPVFRELYLTVEVIPNEIKIPLIQRLAAKQSTMTIPVYKELYDNVLGVLRNTEHKPLQLAKFIQKMRIEDKTSKKSLVEVVPEWRPYFE